MRRAARLVGAATVAFGALALGVTSGDVGRASPTKVGTSITTAVHNPAHQVVSVVEMGTPVHEFASVAKQPGVPAPTGNVEVLWFLDGSCSTPRAARSDPLGPLDPSGAFDADGFSPSSLSPGARAFRVNYLGDANYFGVDSACDKVVFVPPGIVGLDSVSIPTWAVIDSYDSVVNPPMLYEPGTRAGVFSNGPIALGAAMTYGSVRSATSSVTLAPINFGATVSGDVTAGTAVNNKGTIDGRVTSNSPSPPLNAPAVPPCSPFSSGTGLSGSYAYSAATGDLTVQGGVVLAPGTYCFHNIVLRGLTVKGPVTIAFTGTLLWNGGACVNCAATCQSCYPAPSNLQLLSAYTGPNGVVMKNNLYDQVWASIYAPTTDVVLGTNFYGSVLGKTLTVPSAPGIARIHWDVRTLPLWARFFP